VTARGCGWCELVLSEDWEEARRHIRGCLGARRPKPGRWTKQLLPEGAHAITYSPTGDILCPTLTRPPRC
jgi:hypothetical protein